MKIQKNGNDVSKMISNLRYPYMRFVGDIKYIKICWDTWSNSTPNTDISNHFIETLKDACLCQLQKKKVEAGIATPQLV